MANHVSTYIRVASEEPKVYKKLEELFHDKSYEDMGRPMFLYETLYPESPTEGEGFNYGEMIGAKWAYIENVECGDDYFEMASTSAWYIPDEAIKRLGEILSELDENVLIEFTYEDESLEPIGGGACYQDNFITYEETYEWPDEEELSEEEYNEAYDGMWEDVHDITQSLMNDAVRDIMGNK